MNRQRFRLILLIPFLILLLSPIMSAASATAAKKLVDELIAKNGQIHYQRRRFSTHEGEQQEQRNKRFYDTRRADWHIFAFQSVAPPLIARTLHR